MLSHEARLQAHKARGLLAKRLDLAFYLLAIFSLITVTLSLLLNHSIISINNRSITENRLWAARLERLSELGVLAGAIAKPANTVFESGDVSEESKNLAKAVAQFKSDLKSFKSDLFIEARELEHGIIAELVKVEDKLDKVGVLTKELFACLEKNDFDKAGRVLAKIDDASEDAVRALSNLRMHVAQVQERNFEAQVKLVNTLEQFEYGIAVLIVCMVAGVTFYGKTLNQKTVEDIKEKERYINQLKEAEESVRAIINAAVDGIIAVDEHGIVHMVNPACETMFGYQAEELVGKNIASLSAQMADVDHVQTASEVVANLGRVKDRSFELSGQKKDGTSFPVEVTVSELVQQGNTLFIAVIRDITERKANETALQQSEKRFRVMADSTPVMIWMVDDQGNCTYVNQGWTNFCGLNEASSSGDGWLEVVHPEDKERVVDILKSAIADRQRFTAEYRIKRIDGKYRWILSTGAPMFSHDIRLNGYIGSALDITERKEAEQALKESQERYYLAEVGSRDGLWDWDLLTNYVYYSPRYKEQLSFEDYELENTFQTFDSLLHPDDRKSTFEAMRAHLEDGVPFDTEFRLRTKFGDYRWISSRGQAIWDANGTATRMAGWNRDITERKELERLKDEFVATVSHELRTPLTAIRGALGLVSGGVVGEVNEETSELLDIASSNCERLVRLINDILDLEKMEAGKLELKVTALDARELASAAIAGLESLALQEGIKLQLNVEAETSFQGDRDRLLQVLINLLSNAVKFSPKGREVTLDVQLVKEKSWLRFAVHDQGPGIPEDQLYKLWGKFQQLDSSDTRKKGGTGLGLSISKNIVEMHAGKIGAASKRGEGSTFWFEIPLQLGPKKHTGVPARNHFHSSVLVVSEDLELRNVFEVLLSKEGYRCNYVGSVAEAKSLLAKQTPDVVLMDVQKPDSDGLLRRQFVRELKDQAKAVVALSVLTKEDEQKNGLDGTEIITKPVDRLRLLKALRKAISSRISQKVLIVDDDSSVRSVMVSQLTSFGLQCFEAEDGREALTMVHATKPDLIVLDIGLPMMDGFEVVKTLRKENMRNIPLLIYSGRDLSAADRKALTLGLTKHLAKSRTSETEFLATVRQLLAGSEN